MTANLTSAFDTVGRRWLRLPSPTSATPCRRSRRASTRRDWHLDEATRDARPAWADRLEVGEGIGALVVQHRAEGDRDGRGHRRALAGRGRARTIGCGRPMRPWIGTGYRAMAHRYLRGELPEGWEPHDAWPRGWPRRSPTRSDAAAGAPVVIVEPRPVAVDPPRRPPRRRLRPRVVLEPAGLPRRVGARRTTCSTARCPPPPDLARRRAQRARRRLALRRRPPRASSRSSLALAQLAHHHDR